MNPVALVTTRGTTQGKMMRSQMKTLSTKRLEEGDQKTPIPKTRI